MGTANAIDVQEPFTFTDEQQRVIDAAAAGASMQTAAELVGVSRHVVRRWCEKLPAFDRALSHARRAALEDSTDELLLIPTRNDLDANQAKLLSDNIKWLASKRIRDIYGEKLDVDVAVTVNIGAALADARARTLRLQRDNEDALDAECTVLSDTCERRATDTKSEAQTQPVDSSTIPDIFS